MLNQSHGYPPNPYVLFWLIVLLIGIYKCIKIAKRDTTSTICAYALALALGGFFMAAALQMFGTAGALTVVVKGLVAIIFMLLIVAAGCLAVIGLVDYRKHSNYRQGRKQAIAALLISVAFFSIAGAGFYNGLSKRLASPSANASQATSKRVIEFGDLNFRYRFPGKPYVEFDAKSLNPDASFAMLRRNPGIYFIIIGEKIGLENGLKTQDLVKLGKANIESASSSCSFSEEREYTANNCTGINFHAEATMSGKALFYAFWAFQKNGYAYQFSVFGKKSDKEKIISESLDLYSNFEQIEPDQIYYAQDSEPFGLYQSDHFGYTIDLTKTQWTGWQKIAEDFPRADVGAHLGDGVFAFVMPVCYGGSKPHLDILNQILFNNAEFGYPVNGLKGQRPIQEAGMQGYDIAYLQAETGYDVRAKILAGSGIGYLVATWAKNDLPDKEKIFEQFFSSIRFSSQAGSCQKIDLLPAEKKQKQAPLINMLGLAYNDSKQYEKSLAYFRMASRWNPGSTTYLANCLDSFNRLGQHTEALEFLDAHGSGQPYTEEILSWKAWHLKESTRFDESLAAYGKLFSGDYKNDEDFMAYVRVLANKERWAKLETVFDSYLKDNKSIDLHLEQVRVLQKQNRHEDAIQKLLAFQRSVAFNTKIAYAFIQSYNAIEQPRNALEITKELIDKGYASSDAYYYKGDAEYRLKWYREAKKSLEKASELAPRDEEIKSYIKHVSAFLGEGDNSNVKNPIEPVPLPEVIAKRIPSAEIKPIENGFDSYYPYIVKGYAYQKGKVFKHTTYKSIKVLNAAGVSRFSTLEIDFDPLSEKIFVNKLIVKDQEGTIVSRGNPADYYVADRQNGEMATHDQTLHIPVPQLLPGYTIELVSTMEELNASEDFPFKRIMLSSSRPVILSAFFYEGDPKAISYRAINASKPIKTDNGLVLILESPTIYRWEPNSVSHEAYMPFILLSSSGHTWEQIAHEYIQDIKDRLRLDEDTRALANRLIKKAPAGELDRIYALAQYVQTDYTYKAIEFGSRGRMPNSAAMTIKNKYGDCKDHALLLHQLLKAAGITSYLALVSTDNKVDTSLPSLDQFNHMIVYVPSKTGGRFFDVTDKDQNVRLSTPAGLANSNALVLNEQKGCFMQIPAYDENNGLKSYREIEIINENDLRVTEQIAFHGYTAGFMRSVLKSIEGTDHLAWSQEWISKLQNSAKVTSFKISHLFDNSRDLILDLQYEIPRFSIMSEKQLSFKTPAIWEQYYLEVLPFKDRRTDFRIPYPFSIKSKVAIKAPDSYRLISVDENKKEAGGPFCQWRTQIAPSDNTCELALSCTLKAGVFDSSKYPAYQSLMEQVVGSISTEMHFMRNSASDNSPARADQIRDDLDTPQGTNLKVK
jgi:tetratricopeptide (TPR) repeat protein